VKRLGEMQRKEITGIFAACKKGKNNDCRNHESNSIEREVEGYFIGGQ